MTENEVPDDLFDERVFCTSADMPGQTGAFEDWV